MLIIPIARDPSTQRYARVCFGQELQKNSSNNNKYFFDQLSLKK